MTEYHRMSGSHFELVQTAEDAWRLTFPDDLNQSTATNQIIALRSAIKPIGTSHIEVDLADINRFDDYGALVLLELRQQIEAGGGRVTITGATPPAQRILSAVNFDTHGPCLPIRTPSSTNVLLRLGDATITQAVNIKFLVSFIGSVALGFLYMARHPRSLRINDTIACMEKTGVNAIPIVGLIAFLLGMVIAFMSSIQLRQFGANIYVASLVALSMVSELAPIMTAIVVAGRSGSAFAAEIGTMKITEEVDALVTMGFDPTYFLVIPRIVASLIVIPILTLLADVFAIAGGLLVGISALDLTATSYMAQTIETLTLFEVMWGASKSLVFAFIIAWVGCLRGFQTRGGADAVGNSATSAVVSSVFLIILVDSAFAIIRSYW